jgi:hypothetical protein
MKISPNDEVRRTMILVTIAKMARPSVLLAVLLLLAVCDGFVQQLIPQRKLCAVMMPHRVETFLPLMSRKQVDDDQDDGVEFTAYRRNSTTNEENDAIDRALLFPAVNVRKESILFGEDPATVASNNSLRLWKLMKKRLPYIFTGVKATSDVSDFNPMGGIYNVIFVRLPTILAGCVYVKNLVEGHPLVVDVGDGPFAVNPLAVAGVLYIILLR